MQILTRNCNKKAETNVSAFLSQFTKTQSKYSSNNAFAKAARMGDMQALTNLEIIEYNKNVE